MTLAFFPSKYRFYRRSVNIGTVGLRGAPGAAAGAAAVTAAGAEAVTAPPPRRSVRGAAEASALPDKWREYGALKKKKKPRDFVGCLLDTRLKARFFQAERQLVFPQLNGKPRDAQKHKKRTESFLSVVFLTE